MPRQLVSTVLAVIGGVVGGALGYWAVMWFWSQGFYALVLPGAMLGFGSGLLAQHRSMLRGVICGVAALGLTVFTAFRLWKLPEDESFSYFVTHYHTLSSATLLMTVAGTLLGFWMGKDSGSVSLGRKPAPPRGSGADA
jgi:fucose permease